MKYSIEKIWYNFNNELKNYIKKRIKNIDDADDILQEVFIKIHKNIGKLSEQKALKSWLYRITSNTIIDYYRKTKKLDFIIDEDIDNITNTIENENEYDEELSKCLSIFLNNLPEIYKEALYYTEIKGNTQKALSEKLNISLPGAKSRIKRAKLKIKDMFIDCCEFEIGKSGRINMDCIPKNNLISYSCDKGCS